MTRRLLASAMVAVLARVVAAARGEVFDTALRDNRPSAFIPAHVAKLMLAAPALSTPGGAVKDAVSDAASGRAEGRPSCWCSVAGEPGQSWLRVLLPTRPNGASGWIPRDEAASRNPVEGGGFAGRPARVRDPPGRLVRSFPVVVARPGYPHPDRPIRGCRAHPAAQPDQFYGSWMLTLTAHSTVLNTFAGGDGRVALHGRGGSSLSVPVGTASSHGCVRMRNGDIDWLARHAEAGRRLIVARSLQR